MTVSSNNDARDPYTLSSMVEVVDPLTMASRLASEPPPHKCCGMAPVGVKNGGQAVGIDESLVAYQLKSELPEALRLPNIREDMRRAFNVDSPSSLLTLEPKA